MRDDQGSDKRTAGRWIRIAVIAALALAAWLSRISVPHDCAILELDSSYQQALGHALAHGLRFGRELVFTSGPLAYFSWSPFEPDLYWAKYWLWDGLLGALIAFLLFSRLVQRGTWIDVLAGALLLIFLPRRVDGWLFVMGLLAADLGLRSIEAPGRARRACLCAMSLLLLSILTLIKVTSLTLALAVFAILVLRAASGAGWRTVLRWCLAGAAIQSLVWIAIGQDLRDLPLYFYSSIELASGFDSAMGLRATPLDLGLGIACLVAGLGLCVHHALRGSRVSRASFDGPRAQALAVAAALALAYKAGFTRADHDATFFNAAMVAPLFLLPLGAVQASGSAWKQSGLRCAVALLTASCGFTIAKAHFGSPAALARELAGKLESSTAWLAHPREVRAYLEESREKLAETWALPRIKALVGERGVSAFSTGHGVLLINDLPWKPQPVFQSFSVFTARTTRANADFFSSDPAAAFVLLRGNTIDRRLPSSEDPLGLQVLLRDFRPRANEGGFLLLERVPPRPAEPRSSSARGTTAWNATLQLPRDSEPLVLKARIRHSLFGELRAALYQTPAVNVFVEFEDGKVLAHRIAPFALEAGVVLRPWLPTNADWIANACGEPLDNAVGIRFATSVEAAFSSSIDYEFERAPDLRAPPLDSSIGRELRLGAAGELPLRYESALEPELVGWEKAPTMLFVHGPASLFYRAGPGTVRLSALLIIPPWIAQAPDCPGVEVAVYAMEGDQRRECARFDVGMRGQQKPTLELDLELRFESAGELCLRVTPQPSGDPELGSIAIRKLSLKR